MADNDRDVILASIRRARERSTPVLSEASSGTGIQGFPGVPVLAPQQDDADLLGRFIGALSAYEANVSTTTSERLAEKVAWLIASSGIRSLVVPSEIDRGWLHGIEGNTEIIFDSPDLSYQDLATIDGSLTSSSFAIAPTGTIGLTCKKDEGRRAITLLPDFHFCVVSGESILASVTDALSRLESTNPVTLISGPSATSDIELVRVEGVHGPRHLFVVIVE